MSLTVLYIYDITILILNIDVGEELVSKVSHIELMKNEESGKILTEAKDYHIVIPTQPVMQTPRTQV